jgi:HK97 family phage prohead protease
MNDGALVELREDSPGKLVLRGYASVSERWYPVSNLFEEKVNRGTWRRCLADGPDTVLVADHEGLAFARTKTPSGTPTLLLSETDRGLRVEAFLDASAPRVQDLRSTSENAGLQMSVGFLCSEDRWNEDRSRRELIQASVHRGDVTVCNYGANNAAAAAITGRGEAGEAERRAHVETLRGSRERRMCPMLGYDLRGDSAPRGRSQIAVPRPLPRSYVEDAKAIRARLRRAHPGSAASVDGEAEPDRYTDDEVQKLGEEGKAHKRTDGKYNFPIADRRDLLNAIKAWGRARASERVSVKAFIKLRAALMSLEELLPASWQKSVPEGKARSRAGARANGDADPDADDACPACDGSGECANCAGTGSMASESVGGQPQ